MPIVAYAIDAQVAAGARPIRPALPGLGAHGRQALGIRQRQHDDVETRVVDPVLNQGGRQLFEEGIDLRGINDRLEGLRGRPRGEAKRAIVRILGEKRELREIERLGGHEQDCRDFG